MSFCVFDVIYIYVKSMKPSYYTLYKYVNINKKALHMFNCRISEKNANKKTK